MFALAAALTFFAAGIAAQPSPPTVHDSYNGELPNAPGKHFTATTVTYPPGGKSKSHRHDAFVFAYVISGHVRSQVEGEALHVYGPGESWTEKPGSHHVVSENASEAEPASFIAILVSDAGKSPKTDD